MQQLLLNRGDFVISAKRLDPRGADVPAMTVGVVFEAAEAYGDGGGPMVRWFSGGACNVYPGDVMVAPLGFKPASLPPDEAAELREQLQKLEDLVRARSHLIAINFRLELQAALQRLRAAVPTSQEVA